MGTIQAASWNESNWSMNSEDRRSDSWYKHKPPPPIALFMDYPPPLNDVYKYSFHSTLSETGVHEDVMANSDIGDVTKHSANPRVSSLAAG